MTCREITELATDHELGLLPAAAWLRFRWHVTFRCGHCRRYLRQLRAATRLLKRVTKMPPA